MSATMPVCTRYNKAQEIASKLGFMVERAANLYKIWQGSISGAFVGLAANLKEVAAKINAAIAEQVEIEVDVDESPNQPPTDPQEEDVEKMLSCEDAAIVMSVYLASPVSPDEIGDVRFIEGKVSIQLRSGFVQIINKIIYLNCWRRYHGLNSVCRR